MPSGAPFWTPLAGYSTTATASAPAGAVTAGSGVGVVDRAVAAVVEHDRQSGGAGARGQLHLDELAGVGAGVVVVQLGDERGGGGAAAAGPERAGRAR